MSSILIRGARVLSPADGIDRVMNVYIEDGVIREKPGNTSRLDNDSHSRRTFQ